jgi:hypothetical protein
MTLASNSSDTKGVSTSLPRPLPPVVHAERLWPYPLRCRASVAQPNRGSGSDRADFDALAPSLAFQEELREFGYL